MNLKGRLGIPVGPARLSFLKIVTKGRMLTLIVVDDGR